MRALDFWALTSDLDPNAPLKTTADGELHAVTGYVITESQLILQTKAGKPARHLANLIKLTQQPTIRQLTIATQRADVLDAPIQIIYGCQFRDRAVILN